MKEFKRVFLSPRLLGLLGLLLLINLFLFYAEDHRSAEAFQAYNETLDQVRDMPIPLARQQISRLEEEKSAYSSLFRWAEAEEGPLKETFRERCEAYFGAGFEERYAQGELSIDVETMDQMNRKGEMIALIASQLEHLESYPEFLDQVHENAAAMRALSLFNKEDSFSLRNIDKTDADFPREVELRLDNDLAVTWLAKDQLGGASLLIYVMAVVLSFLQERRRGLWSLVHGTKNGRLKLAAERSGILFACSSLGTGVLLGGKLLIAAIRYGGIGDPSRTIQSLAVFSDVTQVISVGQYLIFYFAAKILGIWLLGMLVWILLQAVHHLPFALAICAAFLAAEYSAFRYISDTYSVVVFRYLNVFALADIPSVALHYLNINWFGQPMQGYVLAMTAGLILIVPLCALAWLLACFIKPVTRQNSLLKLGDRLRVPFSSLTGRLGMFGMESYKQMFLQKGILIAALFVLFLFTVMEAPRPDKEMYEEETAYLAASLAGPCTQEKKEEIDSRIAKYSAMPENDVIRRQIQILQILRSEVEDSLAQKDGRWLVNALPLAALMNLNAYLCQRQTALILILVLILLLSGLFAMEKQNRMEQLLRGTPRGRGSLFFVKIGIAFLLTTLVWAAYEARELFLIHEAYGEIQWQAPLKSFLYFEDSGTELSVRGGVILYLLVRLIGMYLTTAAICLISVLCRRTQTSLLASVSLLAVPAALSYMQIRVIEPFTPLYLYSPLEGFSLSPLIALCALAALIGAAWIAWRRTP